MNIVLLGAPGAGKGTQGEYIVEKFKLCHISTGDIFRKHIKENTPLGIKAKEYIDKGNLVPDSVVIDIVKDRITKDDCKGGYLLDGFPRTVVQAEELEKISNIDAVVNLNMDFDTLLYRLSGRRVCEKCGKTTHIEWIKEGDKCECGGNIIQRKDDNEETVKMRLKVYDAETQPLIDYYKEKGKLIVIDSGRDKALVAQDVNNALQKFVK